MGIVTVRVTVIFHVQNKNFISCEPKYQEVETPAPRFIGEETEAQRYVTCPRSYTKEVVDVVQKIIH